MPLSIEIKNRLAAIKSYKAFFREEYQDYGLLLCNPDGTPLDPKSLDKAFKEHQAAMQIKDPIEF